MARETVRPQRSSPETYGSLASRPLYVLCFLAPLILFYEIGAVTYLADPGRGVTETIGAHSILLGLFRDLGSLGRYLPTALMVVVFVFWHALRRDRLAIKPAVLLGMFAESLLWTLPLWVFSLLVPLHPNGMGNVPAASVGSRGLLDLTWQARATLSAGAGLYEELLFRVVIITAAHFLVVDVLRQTSHVGYVIGALVSALSFAFYHNVAMPTGGVHLGLLAFYCAAGLYFSVIFVNRGFGIVAMTHAMYDLVVLIVQPSLQDSSR
jgi:hypothetical protein